MLDTLRAPLDTCDTNLNVRGRPALRLLGHFVPVSPSVNPKFTPQPDNDPVDWAVSVLPFKETLADWKVIVTVAHPVNGTGAQAMLPCQEADCPLPCMVTGPEPSRHTFTVAF